MVTTIYAILQRNCGGQGEMGMPGNPGITLTTSKCGLLFITDCISRDAGRILIGPLHVKV